MSIQEPLSPSETLLLAPVRGLATAATALLTITCAASVFDAWSDWNGYQVVVDYVAGVPGVEDADLFAADGTSQTAGILYRERQRRNAQTGPAPAHQGLDDRRLVRPDHQPLVPVSDRR